MDAYLKVGVYLNFYGDIKILALRSFRWTRKFTEKLCSLFIESDNAHLTQINFYPVFTKDVQSIIFLFILKILSCSIVSSYSLFDLPLMNDSGTKYKTSQQRDGIWISDLNQFKILTTFDLTFPLNTDSFGM